MSKYRKKPIVVEAIRWDGSDIDEVSKFTSLHHAVCEHNCKTALGIGYIPASRTLEIPTTSMEARPGDWIIMAPWGLYSCKSDVFDATYEAVGE